MTKVSDHIAVKATDSPPEPEGMGALPADLTELNLAQLMSLRVAGKPRSESEEPKVAGLSRNEDLPNDLTNLGLAELMALRVRAGVYEALPEDLTILDIADLMTLGVSAGPSEESEDEKDKESEDEGQILEFAANEDEPVGEDEDASKDESDSNQTVTQNSGAQFTDVDLEPLFGSASEDELVGGDGLDGDGAVP